MRSTTSTIAICVLLTAPTWAATIGVPADAPSIQAGITKAAAGDTVLVACGTYLEHDIAMVSGVVLRSESGEADCVTIDCGRTGTGIVCASVDSTASIEGFTITNAFDSGMTLTDSSPRIAHCALIDNDALYGGGMNCMNSDPVIEHCLFQDNYANGDGAITLYRSSPRITDCEFRENSSFNEGPGAIWCRTSSPTLLRCAFIDNLGDGSPGAIMAFDGSDLTIIDCTFASNDGTEGIGALSLDGYAPSIQVITGCTFHGNAGDPTIWAGMADISISNTIIAGNTGAALAIQDVVPTLTCTDLHDNSGGDWIAPIADQLGQQGNISLDPQFCNASAGDLTLAETSPCAPASDPGCGLIGAWPVGCDDLTPVESEIHGPGRVVLAPCRPNPFNPATTIRYGLPEPSSVHLAVFDVRGRLVRRLKTGEFEAAGFHRVFWHGRDDRGREMSSGVYVYRLRVGDVTATGSMSLIR